MPKTDADWRQERLDEIRELAKEALPGLDEQMKWKKPSNPDGVHTWYVDGKMLGHVQPLKGRVRVTLGHGAKLDDPDGLFNAALNGNSMRAIDVYEDDKLNKAKFKKLLRAAAKYNVEP